MSASLPTRHLAESGWVDRKTMPRGANGRPLCRWCSTEVPTANRTFCCGQAQTHDRDGHVLVAGQGCVHEWLVRSQSSYARRCVWARDAGVCALCGTVAKSRHGHHWQADHIVPVAEGGGSCGLENLRTLCTADHKRVTADLQRRLAEKRRPQATLPGVSR